MTATAPAPPRPRQQPTAERLALVAALLGQAGLKLRAPHDRVVAALAATFTRYPPGHPHAALLGAALNGWRPRGHRRPPDQRAVRRLIAHGQVATVRAVTGELERMAAAEAAHPARADRLRQRLAPIADRDAARAADVVATFWRERGRPPSPIHLAHQLGWPTQDAYGVIRHMIEQEWLQLDRGKRLVPGPRARGTGSP